MACDEEICLTPAAPELLREGIGRMLAEGEEEEWWASTAPLEYFPAPKARPPRGWWTLNEIESAVLAAVDRGMSGVEALARAGGRSPGAERKALIRAFHFCLTAGLIATAWG